MCDRRHLKDRPTIDAKEILDAMRKGDEAARRVMEPHLISVGELLIEAKPHLVAREFNDWIKRNFEMTPRQADYYIDLAYAARRTASKAAR